MASLGTLAAGTAHEINNPLTYLSGNLQYLCQDLPATLLPTASSEIMAALQDARAGCKQIGEIVSSLLAFGRADGEKQEEVDLHSVVAFALKLVAHDTAHRARVVTRFLRPLRPLRLCGSNAFRFFTWLGLAFLAPI
ncbi:MAG: hypothetical protein E2P02_15175 [Acidobacteria bacterium]|nr:MAG: hypothetical protein E2P02_15175 [Acidobacteriota bacterium]